VSQKSQNRHKVKMPTLSLNREKGGAPFEFLVKLSEIGRFPLRSGLR
jgi:hypothetical protein